MDKQASANVTALIESSEDLAWSVDLNFRMLTFNRALQQHLQANFGTAASAGKHPEEVLPPPIAAQWHHLYRRALDEGPFRSEFTFAGGRILEISLNRFLPSHS